MKLVLISDTHQLHDKVILPPGDVLVHAGDFSSYGHSKEVKKFNKWFIEQDYQDSIIIPGNHDKTFEKDPLRAQGLLATRNKSGGRIHFLQDSHVVIGGLKFYGSPWQPWFCDWAFNLPRGPQLREKWDKIPDDTDVLITHSPPHGILDRSHHPPCENIGCEDLLNRVLKLNPKLHIFGHCHAGYGENGYLLEGTRFINASTCDEQYQPTNAPVEIEI